MFVHGELFLCETTDMPNSTIYPELFSVCESEINASCPNRQSITLIFQLHTDLFRYQSEAKATG